MSPRLSIVAALLLGFSGGVAAADDAVNLAGYHLKNRSTFNVTAGLRPPFWPIGWVHRAKGAGPVQEVAPVKTEIDVNMFSVTSILVGHPSLAVINAKSYAEGELLKPTKGVQTWPKGARVRVMKITDGTVTLTCDTQTIVVAMHRPELGDHKSEDDAETQLLQN